ncbi:Hamartin protein-domain-containing protein [Xylariomycetidae sp. FL2044]|nr:Hamartin protein-domain-containing protein [Xylariomycetidae sp. FL2044]
MSSAPTYKDLVKALHGWLPGAALPLPDEILEIIDGFLNKHDEKFDENLSEKLNDELISIFHKYVVKEPERYAPFIAVLRRLHPAIGQSTWTKSWFDLCLPVLNFMTEEKGLASEVQKIVLDVLLADDANVPASPAGHNTQYVAERILNLWLEESEVMGGATDPLQDFKQKQIRNSLMQYGKKRPKDLMTLLAKYVNKKSTRSRTLMLLAIFIQSQPPHLYLILQTPLFLNLLNCLQQDTSTTVVSLALAALTMILPHMPSSLVPHLPTLFNIYARLLFWERELIHQERTEVDQEQAPSPNASSWERITYSPNSEEKTIPHLMDYFTILYGLYPINFMDYIRKPQRYLRHAEASSTEDMEIQPTEIRHASERFRQCHLLHENFYTLTIDSEKTDFGRWIKSEPAEVVADCMALCQLTDPCANQDAPDIVSSDRTEGFTAAKSGHESALLASSFSAGANSFSGLQIDDRQPGSLESNAGSYLRAAMVRHPSQSSHQSTRDSTSTRPSGNGGDSPILSRQIPTSGSQTHLQDMINSNKVIKSGLHQSLANDSVPSLSLSHHESVPERPIPQVQSNLHTATTPVSAIDTSNLQVASLNQQILLLYNDLTFERFMKQQHITHMGELRRRHVREAASEAETQNLINVNRQLKQRLEDAKKSELQVKKDSERSRTLAKKWEADLTAKLRVLREEQRKWHLEGEALRVDLGAAKDEAEKLRALVCKAEVRELGVKQDMQSVEINVGEMERLRKEVERLTEAERDYQAKENERQTAMSEAATADSRAEMLDMKLRAMTSEVQQTRDLYESQIVLLKAKLQDALRSSAERKAESVNAQLESVLAASRAQQSELRNRIAELSRKNTAQQATILELRSAPPSLLRIHSQPLADSELSSDSDSPLSFKNRRHRGFSNPEMLEATSYNATPPLEPYHISRPSTPAGTEVSSTSKGSPTTERYFGRGGIQNRREKKDKKDDKDKKKSTGLRGIRGFV